MLLLETLKRQKNLTMNESLKNFFLYAMTAVICVGVIFICVAIAPTAFKSPPEIKVYSVYDKPLHRAVKSINDITESNHKRIIRPGSYFYIHREYEMIGNSNSCRHFTWFHGIDNGFYFKYPSQDVIGTSSNGGFKTSFYYRLPSAMELGEYKLTTRIICTISPFVDDWKFEFPVTYFTVR